MTKVPTATLLQNAQALLAPWAQETKNPSALRLDVVLRTADLTAAVEALRKAKWGYLAAITGLDLGAASGEMEVLYHFCADAAVVTLRLRTPQAGATVPTITHIIPPATLYERELIEMFGVTVTDTPNTEHLFLPDDWANDTYPLRKDFSVPEGHA
jgi:NADH:ubiquinone oxidoreductase subunit C